jgi:autotransporter-associated beta strand protein
VGFSVTPLTNGGFVVGSLYWNGRRGAATWGSGTSGQTLDGSNTVTPQNSLLGLTDHVNTAISVLDDASHQAFVAAFPLDGTGRVVSGFVDARQLTYARGQSQSVTIMPALLTRILNTGGAVVLEASNDITINSPITVIAGGNGGALTLHAGRSIFLNATITTDNGPLTLIANDRLANGVVNAQRDPGPAVITMAAGTTLNTGTGALTVLMNDGAGLVSRASGPITLQTVNAGTVTVTNSGPTAGSDVVVGPVTNSGAQTYVNANGTTVVAGNLSAAAAISFQNSVAIGAGETITAPAVNFSGSGTQILSDPGGSLPNVVHNGSGILQLASALTVSGAFTNAQGFFDANGQTVTVAGPASVSGGLFIASSAAQAFNGGLALSGAGTFLGQTGGVTVGGDFRQSGGTMIAPSANLSIAGNLVVSGGIFNSDGSTVILNGAADQVLVSGGQFFANLVHAGGGTLRLAGEDLVVTGSFTNASGAFDTNGQAVTVWGLTTIANGTQYLGSSGSQYFGGGLSMPAGGSLDGNNLTLGGDVTAGEDFSTNPATITGNLSLDDASRTFATSAGVGRAQLLISAVLSGDPGVGLIVTGAGTLRLLGNNTYTGPTTIQSGHLVVDGTQAASDVILSGGSLSGQGTVGNITANGGTLSPGDPEATNMLTSSGNASLASAATFSVRLNGLNAGADYDQLNISGAANLNSDGGAGSTLAVSVGYEAQVGDTFMILTAAGGVSDTFAGLPEGTTFTAGALTFQITYQVNGGTAVLLTCIAGPSWNRRAVALPSGIGVQALGTSGKQEWTLAVSEQAFRSISQVLGQVSGTTPDGTGASTIARSDGVFRPLPKTPLSSRSGSWVAVIDQWFASKSDEPAWMASWFDYNPLAGGDEWWSQVG